MASGGGTSSTLAALVKAKAQIAKTAIALGLTPRPVGGPMRGSQPENPAVTTKPPELDVDMLAATREFFKSMGGF